MKGAMTPFNSYADFSFSLVYEDEGVSGYNQSRGLRKRDLLYNDLWNE